MCDGRVFHDCYDSIVKSTTEPCQDSEMLHFVQQVSHCLYALTLTSHHNHVRGANFEADMLSHIIRRAGICQSPHSTNNDNYMNWPMTM